MPFTSSSGSAGTVFGMGAVAEPMRLRRSPPRRKRGAPPKKNICNVSYLTLPSRRTRHLFDALIFARASVMWRTSMPITELAEQSAPRAELDQRSREARLRLEQVERRLVVRPLPRRSLLRRVVHCLRSRIYAGLQTKGRSADATRIGMHPERGRRAPDDTSSAADSSSAARLAAWSHCARDTRVAVGRPVSAAFKPW